MQTLAALRFACAWGFGLAASPPGPPPASPAGRAQAFWGLRVPGCYSTACWVAGHRGRRCEGTGNRRGPGERASDE